MSKQADNLRQKRSAQRKGEKRRERTQPAAAKPAKPRAAAAKPVATAKAATAKDATVKPAPTLRVLPARKTTSPSLWARLRSWTQSPQGGFLSFFARPATVAGPEIDPDPIIDLTLDQLLSPEPIHAVPLKRKASLKASVPPILIGMAVGASSKAALGSIVTYFGVAAGTLTFPATGAVVAPLIAAAVTAVTLGVIGGIAAGVVRELYARHVSREATRESWGKVLRRSAVMGGIGGLMGGIVAHWFDIASLIGEHNAAVGNAMTATGNAVRQGWHACWDFVGDAAATVKNGVVALFTGDVAPTPASLSGVAAQAAGSGPFGVALADSTTKALPPVLETPVSAPLPDARPDLLHNYGHSYIAAQEHLLEDLKEMADAPAPYQGTAPDPEPWRTFGQAMPSVPTAPVIAMPEALHNLMGSQEVFNHLPQEAREQAAQMIGNKTAVPARQAMNLFADWAFHLFNGPDATLADKRAAFALWKDAAQIAADNGWLDSKIGKLVNTNLAYLMQLGFGSVKGKMDIAKLAFHAVLGEGTEMGDKFAAAIRRIAPGAMKKAAEQVALQRQYTLRLG